MAAIPTGSLTGNYTSHPCTTKHILITLALGSAKEAFKEGRGERSEWKMNTNVCFNLYKKKKKKTLSLQNSWISPTQGQCVFWKLQKKLLIPPSLPLSNTHTLNVDNTSMTTWRCFNYSLLSQRWVIALEGNSQLFYKETETKTRRAVLRARTAAKPRRLSH